MFDKINQNLKSLGYTVSVFSSASDAADYIESQINGRTVGFGGSVTLEQMGFYEIL